MTENTQQEYNIHRYVTWDNPLKKRKSKKKTTFHRQRAILGILSEPVEKRLPLRRSRTISEQRKWSLKQYPMKYLSTTEMEQGATSLSYF